MTARASFFKLSRKVVSRRFNRQIVPKRVRVERWPHEVNNGIEERFRSGAAKLFEIEAGKSRRSMYETLSDSAIANEIAGYIEGCNAWTLQKRFKRWD
jgi:hypothetical protein